MIPAHHPEGIVNYRLGLRHHLAAFLLLLLFFGLGTEAVSQDAHRGPMLLDDNPTLYSSAKGHLWHYRDPSLTKTAEEIATSRQQGFKRVDTRYIDFGLSPDRIWLRWDAQNVTDEVRTIRIDMKRQYFTELKLYEIGAGMQPLLLLEHTQEDRFSEREIPSRFLLKDVTFQPGETKTFLIAYRSSTTTFLPLAMGTVDGVFANHRGELSVDTFLNGMLASMIIYSFLMLPVIGWRLALSFAGYIGAGAFYVLVADGYPMRILWPNSAWLNEPMNLASMLMMTAFGLNFCRQLFDFRVFAQTFDKLLLGLMVLAIVCTPLCFGLIGQGWFSIPAYFLPVLANVTVCLAGAIALKNVRIGALPFLAGALLVLSALVYSTLAHLVPGRFDLDATLDYGHIALLGECLAFALAILIRFLSIRRQRDEALAAEIEASEQKLRLSEELVQSQRDFEEAKSHAERGRQLLSDMSHDIRQPLLVLKDAVARLGKIEGRKDERLDGVIDFLEEVAQDQLREDASQYSVGSEDVERFSARIVMDNIGELYRDAAAGEGIKLKIRPSELEIASNPIAMMRALSNLVDNAIKHGGGDTILLAARRREKRTRIEVWNNGSGLSSEQIETMKVRGAKGEASHGSGLGLDIVQRICADLGHAFEFHSDAFGSAAFVIVE